MQATDEDIFIAGCGPTPKPDQLNCVTQHRLSATWTSAPR